MPLHPLLVHAVVVLVPLGALSAGLFAVVPRWRWLLRWPTLALGVVDAGLVQLAVVSGRNLEDTRHLHSALLDTHEMWGTRLRIAVFVLAVLVVVAQWLIPYVVPLVDHADRESPVPVLVTPAAGLLALAAVAVLVLVVLTGDAGARAVWQSG